MRDPSLDAKNFCSSANRTCEVTNATPGTGAVWLRPSRKAILVSSGTSNGSFLNVLVHVVTTLSASASTTLRVASMALAFAIATACSAAVLAEAPSTTLDAAKPHAPLTSTRRPKP